MHSLCTIVDLPVAVNNLKRLLPWERNSVFALQCCRAKLYFFALPTT